MILLHAGRDKHSYVETRFPPVMDTDDTQPLHGDQMDLICKSARELLEEEIPETPPVGHNWANFQ